jgi:hypothetical protein
MTVTRSAGGDIVICEALAAAGIRRDHDISIALVARGELVNAPGNMYCDTMYRDNQGGAA